MARMIELTNKKWQIGDLLRLEALPRLVMIGEV